MLSADFVFTVIFFVLVPLAVICSACLVADTVLAYIRHREEKCWICKNARDEADFVQNDQNNC